MRGCRKRNQQALRPYPLIERRSSSCPNESHHAAVANSQRQYLQNPFASRFVIALRVNAGLAACSEHKRALDAMPSHYRAGRVNTLALAMTAVRLRSTSARAAEPRCTTRLKASKTPLRFRSERSLNPTFLPQHFQSTKTENTNGSASRETLSTWRSEFADLPQSLHRTRIKTPIIFCCDCDFCTSSFT